MTDNMDTINRTLGEHSAAIRNMESNHQRCGETVSTKLSGMDTEIKAVRIDIKGLQDQMAGSLECVSDLEKQMQSHETAITGIEKARFEKWTSHDSHCSKCVDNIKEQTRIVLDEYFKDPENMGVIALCKKEWKWIAVGVFIFALFFEFKADMVKFVIKEITHGSVTNIYTTPSTPVK